jgi:DNA-binding response OmpR family regulator
MSSLEKLEDLLSSRGFPPDTRKAIKNAKICIVDDKLEDLQSFVDGLKTEGFTNLIEMAEVSSVDAILQQQFDLVILDLAGVAQGTLKDDGIGVLENLKRAEPWLPILVVTGSSFEIEHSKVLSAADLARSKPILPSDLAADVELLLRYKKDAFWAALDMLKELRKLSPEISDHIGWIPRFKLAYYRYRVTKDLENNSKTVTDRLLKIAAVVNPLGSAALRIQQIAKGFSD